MPAFQAYFMGITSSYAGKYHINMGSSQSFYGEIKNTPYGNDDDSKYHEKISQH